MKNFTLGVLGLLFVGVTSHADTKLSLEGRLALDIYKYLPDQALANGSRLFEKSVTGILRCERHLSTYICRFGDNPDMLGYLSESIYTSYQIYAIKQGDKHLKEANGTLTCTLLTHSPTSKSKNWCTFDTNQ